MTATTEHTQPGGPGGQEPRPVDGLHDRIAAAARTVRLRLGPNALAQAQRGDTVPLSLGEADQVADAVMQVLAGEAEAWGQAWHAGGYSLRHCLIPGCLREFDLLHSQNQVEGRSPAGWRQSRAVDGYACPEHAALWTGTPVPHGPAWHHPGQADGQTEDEPHTRSTLTCSCGWFTTGAGWRGHATTLWKAHALDVLQGRVSVRSYAPNCRTAGKIHQLQPQPGSTDWACIVCPFQFSSVTAHQLAEQGHAALNPNTGGPPRPGRGPGDRA